MSMEIESRGSIARLKTPSTFRLETMSHYIREIEAHGGGDDTLISAEREWSDRDNRTVLTYEAELDESFTSKQLTVNKLLYDLELQRELRRRARIGYWFGFFTAVILCLVLLAVFWAEITT